MVTIFINLLNNVIEKIQEEGAELIKSLSSEFFSLESINPISEPNELSYGNNQEN